MVGVIILRWRERILSLIKMRKMLPLEQHSINQEWFVIVLTWKVHVSVCL